MDDEDVRAALRVCSCIFFAGLIGVMVFLLVSARRVDDSGLVIDVLATPDYVSATLLVNVTSTHRLATVDYSPDCLDLDDGYLSRKQCIVDDAAAIINKTVDLVMYPSDGEYFLADDDVRHTLIIVAAIMLSLLMCLPLIALCIVSANEPWLD